MWNKVMVVQVSMCAEDRMTAKFMCYNVVGQLPIPINRFICIIDWLARVE